MAFIRADFCKETTTTTGTGTVTLLGARNPARAFSVAVANGDTFKYAISHTSANEWEVGTGTMVSSTTFSRSVIASSNANALVSFSAGTKNVDLVCDAADLNTFDRAATTAVQGQSVLATTTDVLTGTNTTEAVTPDALAAMWEKGADNAGGAGTLTFGDGYQFDLTAAGTVTALAFTTDKAGRMALLRIGVARQFTHNATTLISPTGANLLVSPGEYLLVESLGSGNFRIIHLLGTVDQGMAVATLTANASASAAVTDLPFTAAYNIPANYSQVGSMWEFFGYYVFLHAAAGTPTLTLELLVNGVVVDSIVVTPQTTALTFAGSCHGFLTIRTTGAGGTLKANCRVDGNVVVANGNDGSVDTATDAIDTTVARSIQMRMRMTTAVASNTLTVTQGFIRKVR